MSGPALSAKKRVPLGAALEQYLQELTVSQDSGGELSLSLACMCPAQVHHRAGCVWRFLEA